LRTGRFARVLREPGAAGVRASARRTKQNPFSGPRASAREGRQLIQQA
jgi:hypothetical protein